MDPKIKRAATKLRKQILTEYGIDDVGGIALLDRAIEAYIRMREAAAIIEEKGLVFENRFGELRENPAAKIELRSRQQFLAAMRLLNLDVEPPNNLIGRPGGH